MEALLLQGECHNGRNAEREGDAHWRLEARGDDDHYCYYFHFGLQLPEASDMPRQVILDIAPDRERPGGRASFRAHRPPGVWISHGAGWERHPADADPPADCVRLRLVVPPGRTTSVSRMRPCPWSEITDRLAALVARDGARGVTLGGTAEGRELAAIEIGSGPIRVLVLAGQHPAEFGGCEAVLGIAAWLLSRVPEAVRLRDRLTVTCVPCINPDGNVRGNTGRNAQGHDLYRSFSGAASGEAPAPPEAGALWRSILAQLPALTLNFHTYTQAAPTGSFPWEGLYTPPDGAFRDLGAHDRQRRLDDLLGWETGGLSQSGRFAAHIEGALEYQLAALGIPSVFYEVQDLLGPHRHQRTGVHVLRTALRALDLDG